MLFAVSSVLAVSIIFGLGVLLILKKRPSESLRRDCRLAVVLLAALIMLTALEFDLDDESMALLILGGLSSAVGLLLPDIRAALEKHRR